MRNGNTNHNSYGHLSPHGSYPTYEEWKHEDDYRLDGTGESSYPTYEEWKQLYKSIIIPDFSVLILPMRNGNVPNTAGFLGVYLVLILPMRNGNYSSRMLLVISNLTFLSYL